MMRKDPSQRENLDYAKLLKNREQKEKLRNQNSNPFLLSNPPTDKQLYQYLYKFDVNTELKELNFPDHNKGSQKKLSKLNHDANSISKIPVELGKTLDSARNALSNQASMSKLHEYDEYTDELDQENTLKKEKEEPKITRTISETFKNQNKKQQNKIQDALFYTKEVKEQLSKLITGEDAISFFAKYGNATPIKYINCVRTPSSVDVFRPYDLIVLPYREGDITEPEYYTISAHGIVHVIDERFKKKRDERDRQEKLNKQRSADGKIDIERLKEEIMRQELEEQDKDISTEFVSLSEWMHESTLFNIIIKLSFFKNFAISKYSLFKKYNRYNLFLWTISFFFPALIRISKFLFRLPLKIDMKKKSNLDQLLSYYYVFDNINNIGKIFNIWKLNVRYRIFCKKRQELIAKVYYAKPQFSINLMEINKLTYDFNSTKTISILPSKNWELEDFKNEQKRVRNDAIKHYENVIEKIIGILDAIKKQVLESKNVKLPSDSDDAKIGQKVKQKPMVVIKKEMLERELRRKLALQDERMLGNLIRLIDYMVIEALVHVHHSSMSTLYEEMNKERKNGLFITSVFFGEKTEEKSEMTYNPPEEEIHQAIDYTVEEMIKSMNPPSTPRIANHPNFDGLFRGLNIPDVRIIILESRPHKEIRKLIKEKIETDFAAARKHVVETFEPLREIDEHINNWKIEAYKKANHSIDEIQKEIQKLRLWLTSITKYIKDTPKGIIYIEGKRQKDRLYPAEERNLNGLKEYVYYDLMKVKAEETHKEFTLIRENLKKDPPSLDQFAKFIENLTETKNRQKILEQSKNDVETMHNILRRFENSLVSNTDTVTLKELIDYNGELNDLIKRAEELKKDKSNDWKEVLEKDMQTLAKDITSRTALINSGKLISEETSTQEALKELNGIRQYMDRFRTRNKELCHYYKLIHEKPAPENKELKEMERRFEERYKIWNYLDRYRKQKNDWMSGEFFNLNVEEIEKEMKNYDRETLILKQAMSSVMKDGKDKVLETLITENKEISNQMQIIVALGNKDLKSRHWKKIFDLMGKQWAPGASLYLKDILTGELANFKEQVEEISGTASGQAQIEASIEAIRKKWAELPFTVNPYRESKDKFTLGAVDEVIQTLDDHQVSVQTMLGTRFVAEIKPTVEEWEKKLALVAEVIDEWLSCQRQWMYLENIFTAEDIQKQLPAETAKFNIVDKFWRELMTKTNKKPNVLESCNSEELLKKLQINNKTLEEIQKSLENYLETKRAAFPRFYFLSNDELIEILSQTRNPHAVQPHLRKCFDNINRIEFTDVETSREIISMISAEPETEPEKIRFSASVMAEGNVEHWLMNIQEMMVKSLYDLTKKAYVEYPANGLDRNKWLFSYGAQPVLTVDLIKWTENCTTAILAVQKGRNPNAIKEFLDFSVRQIDKMVTLVRSDLSTGHRSLMGALIVLDVHAREVVNTMVKLKVQNINDFEWSKQLRYYWDREVDNCIVRQTNTRFQYGFEYLGNGPRLVITPLTDKCYMTLTGALHLNYGGAPAGPAGTGKTETTKDLAKALAIQCIVFNCSDNIDYKTMGRFFSGLAQCGAWACFDEFNRIDIEVLSVIAQQIMEIQQAIRLLLDEFDFEGRRIPLNKRFGVFITMNPGYAGRTELPDNLKALFRPVAMMIPDYALIAEIILFSEGFSKANALARKMVQLYKLSSEQLSKQDHYDFGMRAVKSVLVMAGALRRRNPDLTEEAVLIRAMRDSNVPKFLEHDLPLFRGIIKDLFPSENVPFVDYGKLQEAIENQLELAKLQKPKAYITKIIQLMETMMVRHGVMLVGVTGTGKTKCYEILAKALEQLYKDGSLDYYHKPISLYVLNPKSITMYELFGYTNILTNEWTDGIVAKLVRQAVAERNDPKKSESKQWIVFDGPVDAGWIENMNTVLDDNKMLCLSNGERIKLPATFTMMFEVQDLRVASPATVSRCGMVYLEPVHLGWQPILDTWAINMKEKENNRPWIKPFVEKIRVFIEETLKFVRDECKEMIPSENVNLVKSALNIVMVLLTILKEQPGYKDLTDKEMQDWSLLFLIFSMIWSLGGNLNDFSKVKFSSHLKMRIMSIFTNFPYDGEIYDFYIDFTKKEFRPWTELVPEYKYDSQVPYFNILVPTADTVKYKFLVKNLMRNGFNVLCSGETGVGKSVIIQEFLNNVEEEEFVSCSINFSAQTSSKNLMDVFLTKLSKKTLTLYGAPAGKKMLMFIDDVNMPQLDIYGAQPPVELLRQTIDQGGFYDLKKHVLIKIKDTNIVCACAPPGGGRNIVTPRLFRHFNMLWMSELSAKSMEIIFSSILKGFLSENTSAKGLDKLALGIVKSSVEIYLRITRDLLPTPSKSHYTFNLRDLSKVVQGILQIRYEHLTNKDTLFYLWIHEECRVFQDRLIDDKDRDWFATQIEEQLANSLDHQLEKSIYSSIMFGDYTSSTKEYQKIENFAELPTKFDDQMQVYNASTNKIMNLVFFRDAIYHLSRISRILRQPRGNALLVGVGGSGRQSLTRLATFMRGYTCLTIEITKNYKDQNFKDDMKKVLKTAGADDTPVVFFFSDTQILKESFLEDINNILNTGEVPNLWAPEDTEEILGKVRPLAKEAGKIDAKDVIYQHFVQLVRQNLHIVLAFSPVGEKLRNRCRQFPSIINCCTIDWYDRWPDEALYSVAEREYKAQSHLGITQYCDSLSKISVEMHTTVIQYSDRFYEELKRKNYTTPTSYLELLRLYIDMLKYQQTIIPTKIRKYTVGLETLKETNEEVARLQKKIIEMQPVLEQAAKENAELMIELEGKTKDANETEVICSKEAKECQIIVDEVNALRDNCKKDLDEALPIVHKARKAVENIQKKDISEMKALPNPPPLVMTVMGAICLLINKDKKKEGWDDAKKLLSDMAFQEKLTGYDGDNIPDWLINRLRSEYLALPNFNEEACSKVSQAATAMITWVIAIDKYAKVRKVVAPKEKSLKEAEAKLKIVQGELNKKMSALKEVQDTVAKLKENLDNSIRKQQNLEEQQSLAKVQLIRAEKLLAGLGNESERWKVTAKTLEEDLTNVTGNILIAAACIAYIGPFTYVYRQEMIQKWVKVCKEMSIPVSNNFSLERILADPVQVRDWQNAGLPADQLSIDNGIFMFNCRRWPLIIDPQGQANRWIKNMGKSAGNLVAIKLTEPNFLRTLESAIRFGQTVLLENVEEILDPSLEPILMKQVFKKAGQQMLRLGDQDIPYSSEFKFYITTKLPNPHYLPEVCIKVTIINFTVTLAGLEDQLLIEVVRFERIELEEQRDTLIVQISEDNRQLQELEDRILMQISEAQAQGNILNDEGLIQTLEASKVTSETVNQRMDQAKVTAKEINAARENYRGVAKRGSVLYFVIADLALIDPMYQYSLEYFIKIFKKRLELAPNPPELNARLSSLIEDITKSFYINICRGLFEKDKLLFSFMIAAKILMQSDKISTKDWNFFLRGPSIESKREDEAPNYINPRLWKTILALEEFNKNFTKLSASMTSDAESPTWRELLEADDPMEIEIPHPYRRGCSEFERMLLMKVLREEKLIMFVKKFVQDALGAMFIESPPFDLKGAYTDSTCTTPIIFVLSPGADPMSYLLNLAREKEMDGNRFKMRSLGQGQGDIAADCIRTGRRNGDWVVLQNCHLAATWMTELERIQEQQIESETHPEYRLWLTSMPSNKFPVPVLQSGIKLTNEPPKGLKANMLRTYNDINEKNYDGCLKPEEYKKLLFSLAFFHAVILERRKFGAIGWNIPYEWMNSDFETCEKQLKINLDEQPEVPYVALKFLIAEINYGGRVTDDKDVRLITSLLSKYFTPEVMGNKYNFSPSGLYHAPRETSLRTVKEYIGTFPLEDDPEVFGLHPNANITFQQKTVREFMETLLSVSPKVSEKGGAISSDDIVSKMAAEIENKLPNVLVLRKQDPEKMESLDVFRAQEIDRFNKLVRVMKKTLSDLQKAIKGTVVMSLELERMYNSFLNKKVPKPWEDAAYPSLKPLGSWVNDLVLRLEFMKSWIDEKPKSYWISSFFFPQGFMTAVMQTYARRTQIAIDTLTFRTEVRKFYKDNVSIVPEDGVNIHGIFIQGCRWNITAGKLSESEKGVLFSEMPCIWLEPVPITKYENKGDYLVPLYKTSLRAGTLSTTGHSTNFVLYLDLKTDEDPVHWIRRGVALLCQLDD